MNYIIPVNPKPTEEEQKVIDQYREERYEQDRKAVLNAMFDSFDNRGVWGRSPIPQPPRRFVEAYQKRTQSIEKQTEEV